MPGRKVLDEADARQLLDEVERSREPLAAWCRRYRVDGRSLNAWRINLARRDEVPVGPRLVELVVQEPVPRSSSIRVAYGDFTVQVEGEVDVDLLRDVLWAVSTC